jgi:hypothetical protein
VVSAPPAGATTPRPPGRSSPLEAPLPTGHLPDGPATMIGVISRTIGAACRVHTVELSSHQVACAKPTLTTKPILLTVC